MNIYTPHDLGLRLRDRRRALKWSQADLAERVGVTRQWIIEMERGKSTIELGLALKAVSALSLDIDIRERGRPAAASSQHVPVIDIDAIVAAHRGIRLPPEKKSPTKKTPTAHPARKRRG